MSQYAQRVDGHYNVGGVLYPAVSTILAPIKGDYPDDPKWANRGTLMHAAFDAQTSGKVDGTIIDWLKSEIDRQEFIIDIKWVYPYVARIVDWAADNIESVGYSEVPSVSALAGHAGTADAREARLKGSDGRWLLDAKSQASSSPEKWHIAQLAGLHHQTHVALDSGPGLRMRPCDHFGNLYVNESAVTLRTWTIEQINDAYLRCFWQLLCEYRARQIVSVAQSVSTAWLAERRKAGYWPPRVTATDKRAVAVAEQWGHLPQEVG